jgi:hypothetical protein
MLHVRRPPYPDCWEKSKGWHGATGLVAQASAITGQVIAVDGGAGRGMVY